MGILKTDFELKSIHEINQLPRDARLEYYHQYREFVMSLEFDEELNRKQEARYLKTVNGLGKFIQNYFDIKPRGVSDEDDEPMIVVSNHLDSRDQLLISTTYPNIPLHYMIAESLLEPKNLMIGHLYVNRGAFTVDKRDKEDRKMATPRALKHLLRGQSVVILPEGTRTIKYGSDGTVQKFQAGAVLSAIISGRCIKPHAINNNYKKGQLYVNKGSKIYIPEDVDILEATDELQKIVERLWQENKDNGAIIKTKIR